MPPERQAPNPAVTVSVALLRGINVGGSHRVLMTDLRVVFSDAGCTKVETYIQSGNVIFDRPDGAADLLESDLERRIAASTGFAVTVVLRSVEELRNVVADNPFPAADPGRLVVAFFGADPAPGALERLRAAAVESEEIVHRERDLYLHLPHGIGRSKLAQTLSSLPAPVTARNWRTVTKLLELASR